MSDAGATPVIARRKRAPRQAGFSGYAFSIGLALLNVEKLMRHNAQHQIVQQVEDDADEDADGDSVDPEVLFQRQLRKIRRGEQVDRLVLRLR